MKVERHNNTSVFFTEISGNGRKETRTQTVDGGNG